MKKGKVFRLEKVYFDANKYEVKPESEPELTALYKFLNDNPDVMWKWVAIPTIKCGPMRNLPTNFLLTAPKQ